jgi:hypothetical protein
MTPCGRGGVYEAGRMLVLPVTAGAELRVHLRYPDRRPPINNPDKMVAYLCLPRVPAPQFDAVDRFFSAGTALGRANR